MARLNMRFNNLINRFGGITVGGGPPYNNNPQNETGIDYTLEDFLYFNNYDMNNFSFLELLDNFIPDDDTTMAEPGVVPDLEEQSKLKELNEKFLQVFKSNINGVLEQKHHTLTDIENKEAVQDMIACVQEIVELSDFFRILIISQEEIDVSQEDYDMLGGEAGIKRPIGNVNDENVYSLAKRARGDFTPGDFTPTKKHSSSSPLGFITPNTNIPPVPSVRKVLNAKRPLAKPINLFQGQPFQGQPFQGQPVQGQGSAPVLQGPITAVASPVPSPQPSPLNTLPTNYDDFINKLNYLRTDDTRGWINSLDASGEEGDGNDFDGNDKKEITDVFKLYTVLFIYYITKFNNQDNIYSINNSNFIRYGLFSYFANKLVANPKLPFKQNFFIDLEQVQFNYQVGQPRPDTLEKLLGSYNIEILDELAKISNTSELTDKEAKSMYNFGEQTKRDMAVDTGDAQKGGTGVETIYQVFKNNLLKYQEKANTYLNQDFNNFVLEDDDDIAIEGELAPFRYYDDELALLIKKGLETYKVTRKPPAEERNELENELI
jgi:hypothetical protein